MNRRAMILGSLVSAAAKPQAKDGGGGAARERVSEAERGFAGTMARRDHAAFTAYVSDEAVFLGNGDKPALRGKRAVADGWKKFFEAPTPPFSWGPEVVEVLDSGNLALSSGPVRNPQGEVVARFTSIWRLEPDGRWRVIFDRGCPACRCG